MRYTQRVHALLWIGVATFMLAAPAHARLGDRLREAAGNEDVTQTIGEREVMLYVPSQLLPAGQRAMVIALHGGGGNASHLRKRLQIDAAAKKYGFIVAYLNGSDASRRMPASMRAWNAGGGCCGLPADEGIDDVAYISQTTAQLQRDYGVDPSRTFVAGHSNGSMLGQLMLCTTNIFAAGVTISGPINTQLNACPSAAGKRILALHGENDANVPITGGKGTKGPMRVKKEVVFRSQASAKALFEQFGAHYDLEILLNTDHALEHVAQTILDQQGMTLGEKAARFFGLAN
jgi:poly(3-hydroxybutyrate) depolymerase